MKRAKIIFFPIGTHDTAGNKRLKNLSKYLERTGNVKVRFFNPFGDTDVRKSEISIYILKLCYFVIDIFRSINILVSEKEKRLTNFLYFYEGRHIFIYRIIAAKILGYKILIDLVENPNSLRYTKSIIQRVRIVYFLFLYKFIPFYTVGIFVVTKYLKNKIETDFKNKVPVFLLPVSFDSEDLKTEGIVYDYPTIFYGGSYGNNYDFDSLFKAFNLSVKEFPLLRLCLSGNIYEPLKENIKKRIVNHENLMFLGFLDEKDYFQTISSMDILCMPRNNSVHANAGFPFKLAEYLATGKPVITSRVSDVSDYISEDDAFIYDPGDYLKLASSIRNILTNSTFALKIGQNGKLRAYQYFDANFQSQEFYRNISDLAN